MLSLLNSQTTITMTDNYQFCDYHSHGDMLEMSQPKWLLLDQGVWYPLRTYQLKAIENFIDSGAIKLYLDLHEKGFMIPNKITKSYSINHCIFEIEYRDKNKIIQKEKENPDLQSHRQGWNYHQLFLVRENKTESLIMSFPTYQTQEVLEKDSRFNQHGSFHSSCWV